MERSACYLHLVGNQNEYHKPNQISALDRNILHLP